MRVADARATIFIAALTVAASLFILATGALPEWAVQGGFVPLRFDPHLADVHGFVVPAWLTPLTATLIHGGLAHLALNMVMFGFCGAQAERAVGAMGVVILYIAGAYVATLGHYVFEPASQVPMIGASGAISAVVAAYALLYGRRRGAQKGPVADVLHVAWLAAAWVGIQLLIGFAGMGGGGMSSIAIGAHIGGFIIGLALTRPLLRWRYRHA